ncbi:UDP-glucose 4-epimerase family protein [Marinobacter persicus]|uniref:Nucleoside-diphosphate-sugar epimerase n=1 Tax=Marinobacter persicus TaxID=930118 RepID=A0A2S6G6H7_9GAMM|nr:SDR family oxidoreductase [Marinobacter persicus]PPK51355.1 nucleoside-diphosphate-sugar epimerase [Marinobacter persicus]PPK54608.1 nucleoside-diphosphate-sugar epimerase [Marinobacter persicus]PPK58034.1 nucleoside-diphosphate-sugar epimerase [Marinobacter persicus]
MTQQRKLLVTGASGFVGNSLKRRLAEYGHFSAVGAVRSTRQAELPGYIVVGDLDGSARWEQALEKVDVVVHTAARAHIMKDEVPHPLAEYRKVNVDGTLNLARQAAEAGVRRFVFISSIKVNGEQTPLNQPFTAEDTPSPEDAYGISKREAEQGLQALAAETGMEVVIIRPPLVYGPGVKGNFASMIRLVEKGLPLPLGAIHNKRSLVALDNLVDLIITCIDHPAAANQVFLAGDGEDLSTTELLQGVAKAMGKPSRLVPVPAGLLMFGATVLGKKGMAQRLLGSLQVDISKARNLLGWQPPLSVDEGLKRCFPDQ